MVDEKKFQAAPDSTLTCLRCEQVMKQVGSWRLNEGSFMESIVRQVPTEVVEVHACPRCGKVELFL